MKRVLSLLLTALMLFTLLPINAVSAEEPQISANIIPIANHGMLSEGLISVYLEEGIGFLDITGELVIPPLDYEIVSSFSEGLSAVRKGNWETGKWGYIDKTGKEVIPCIYDDAWSFNEGVARVSKDGKEGYIDKIGKEVIPFTYDGLDYFSEGVASVRIGDGETGKWGLVDTAGKEIIPFIYDYIGYPNEGIVTVMIGDWGASKWGLVDTTGKEIIPPIYDEVLSFSEGLAAVKKGDWETGKWGYIDATGKEVIPCIYDGVSQFREGLAVVWNYNTENGLPLCGYIDKTGKEVVPLIYLEAESFNEGLAAVRGHDGDLLYGYIDKTGEEVIPRTYIMVQSFKGGVAEVAKGGNWGLIDTTGKEVIPIMYKSLGSFSEGYIAAMKGSWETGKWGYLDETGKEVIPFIYEYAGSFTDGVTLVSKGRYDNYGFIDKKGNVIVPLEYLFMTEYDYTGKFVEHGITIATKLNSNNEYEDFLIMFNESSEEPVTSSDEYIYDEIDIGESVVLPYEDLENVEDLTTANELVNKAASSMTAEQKASPTGIDKITHFAEAAIKQAAVAYTDDSNIIISSDIISELETRAIETKQAVEETLLQNEIITSREINADVKIRTGETDKLTISIDEITANTNVDNIRVECPDFDISLNVKGIQEEITDDTPLIIVAEEVQSTVSYGNNDTENSFLVAAGSTKTLKISFNKGKVKENITISLPPASGETKYQAVMKEDGTALASKYNPTTGNIQAKINEGGIYTVKENYKDFTDIQNKAQEMQEAIRYLASKGIINGTSETTFSPDGSISRAEIASLIVRALGKLDPNADGGFKDVEKSSWYYGAAGSSKQFGIVTGYEDNTFRGTITIPKDQIIAVSARTLKNEMGYKEPANIDQYLSYTDKQSIASWAAKDIALASRENLVVRRTDGRFNPAGTMTRGDAAIILKRLFDRIW